MTLEQACQTLLETLPPSTHSADQAISLMDLTLLDESATNDDLEALSDKANTHAVAAICVFPQHLDRFPALAPYRRATVVNFPEGDAPVKQILCEMERIICTKQADEIDYVFPWRMYLNGQRREALHQCQEACALSHQGNTLFKVIMETGALPSAGLIYQLSQELINLGCDFLKTSTGKIPAGASPLAAFSMLQALHKEGALHCGIKLSGGIRKPEQAFLYIDMARFVLQREPDKNWFRLGASTLLDELVTIKQVN